MYLRFASTPGWSAIPSPQGSVHVGLPRPHPPAPPDVHALRSRQRRPGPCHLLSRLPRVHLPCRTTNRPRSAGFPSLCVHTPRFAPTPPHHTAGFICSLRSHTAPPPRRIYMFAALTKPARCTYVPLRAGSSGKHTCQSGQRRVLPTGTAPSLRRSGPPRRLSHAHGAGVSLRPGGEHHPTALSCMKRKSDE